jgi:hypothetical protein
MKHVRELIPLLRQGHRTGLILAGGVGAVVLLLSGWPLAAAAVDDFEQPPINYGNTEANNAVAQLKQRLHTGQVKLQYDEHFGYLRSFLKALAIPESSQMLVFSKTSLQRNRISPRTPRALYFNDDIYVGYCQGGEVLEISTADPQLGTVFYTLEQKTQGPPNLRRRGETCLLCHGSSQTGGAPGHLVRSVLCDSDGLPILSAGTYRTDHTSPLAQRWGGWYVTGTSGRQAHLGNLVCKDRHLMGAPDNTAGRNITDLSGRVDLADYPTRHSDIVAQLVLAHQTQAHNLITRASFQTRMALHAEAALNKELKEPPDHRWESTTRRIQSACEPLVKGLLFAGEAKLTGKVQGTATFAADFIKRGPRDGKGRSLRDLDLEQRLFKYPCSYLIYTPSFAALPPAARDFVYERLWVILHGNDPGRDFDFLTEADRRAILEILLATKTDLPDYWRGKR